MPPSRSLPGTVDLVGGRPCLDLVNTVSWRGDPHRWEDHLRTGADAAVWLPRAGVLTPGEIERLAAELDEVLGGLLATRAELEPFVERADRVPDALQAAIQDAIAHSALLPGGWAVTGLDALTPRRRILLDAYELIRLPLRRPGRCADPACGWVFLDVSRRGNRRWCSSAGCGNRDRARRHYDRRTRPPA